MGIATLSMGQNESDFMTPVTVNSLNLQQEKSLSKIRGSYKFKQIELVRLGSFKKIHKDSYLSWKIPGTSKPLRIKTRQLEAKSEQDFLYVGSVQDSLGEAIISARKGIYRANLAFSGKKYELVSVGEGIYAWINLDPPKTSTCGLSDTPSKEPNISPKLQGARIARPGECVNPLRVLLLHTPGAINQDPNIQGLMDQCIGTWNNAAGAQGLTNYQTYITWVGRQQYNFTETGNIFNDRDVFASQVGSLRDQFGADLVVLFTANSYQSANGEILGIAQGIGPSSNGSLFACLVTANQAASNFTMLHELGHLLGAAHNDCNHTITNGCSNTPGSNHGYKFIYHTGVFGQQNHYRTDVMHENYESLEGFNLETWGRLGRFSDPYFSIEGEPTGTVSTHNNRSAVANGLLYAPNYRSGGEQLGGAIEGPNEGMLLEIEYTWEALHTCAQNPTFEWRVSNDGFNYGGVVGTGETFRSNIPVQVYYIWLRINSSDGQSIDRYIEVHGLNGGRIATQGLEINELALFVPAPNPATSETRLDFVLEQDQDIILELTDQTGRSVQLIAEGLYEKGKHSKTLITSGLTSGLYLCRLRTATKAIAQKLVVIR